MDFGLRLDVFLKKQLPVTSRSFLKKQIESGLVLVNGLPGKPSYEVRLGDVITARMDEQEDASQLIPEPMQLDILFEDEDLVVVNKEAGLVVHAGAGHNAGTLVHGLLAHCGKLASQGAPQRPGIVHRLDRDTSGALVVAKTDLAYLDLIGQFSERKVKKDYLALVFGQMQAPRGDVCLPIARHPRKRKQMAVVERLGRESVSRWRVKRQWSEITLLEIKIETGRTHQIRVHFSHLGHPVVGDATYGGGKRRVKSLRSEKLKEAIGTASRQMLHAYRLSFKHPRTGEDLSFVAPLPHDFAMLIQMLDEATVVGN